MPEKVVFGQAITEAPILFSEKHKHCPEAPFASDLQYKPAVMKPNVS